MKTKKAQACASESLAMTSDSCFNTDDGRDAGMIFIDQNEERGPGVRLKDPI